MFCWSLEEVGDLLFCLVDHRHVLSGPGQGGRVAPFMAPVWQSCLYMKVTLPSGSSTLPSLPVRSYRRHGLLSTLMMTIALCTHTIHPYSFISLNILNAECMWVFVFSVPPSLYKRIQLVSEERIWLGPDTWWNKSLLGFKGGYFEQAILQKAFTLNKSTNAPMFQNTAFTASYFISISCTVV